MNRKPVHIEVIARHDEHGERLIKRFIKKVKKSRFLDIVKSYTFYEKPSLKRKRKRDDWKRKVRKMNRERKEQELNENWRPTYRKNQSFQNKGRR